MTADDVPHVDAERNGAGDRGGPHRKRVVVAVVEELYTQPVLRPGQARDGRERALDDFALVEHRELHEDVRQRGAGVSGRRAGIELATFQRQRRAAVAQIGDRQPREVQTLQREEERDESVRREHEVREESHVAWSTVRRSRRDPLWQVSGDRSRSARVRRDPWRTRSGEVHSAQNGETAFLPSPAAARRVPTAGRVRL